MNSSGDQSLDPKVSIVVITYNQDKYIRQSLDGLVMQQTDFPFEIVLGDDHSSDKTPQIIQEYVNAHPKLFKATLRKKNIGAEKNFRSILQQTKGKYLAICEGDDYWTDPHKLQLQVNFLDENPDYSLCFHPVKVIFESGEEEDTIFPKSRNAADFTVEELLKANFIQTNSVLYRRRNDYAKLPSSITPGDWYLHLYHAQFGKIGFINKVMAVYRRHHGGMWWDSYSNMDALWDKYGIENLKFYIEQLKLYGKNDKYRDIIYGHIGTMMDALISTDLKYHKDKLSQALVMFPDYTKVFVLSQYVKNRADAAELLSKTQAINKLNNDLENLKIAHTAAEAEIKDIKESKLWQVRKISSKVRSVNMFSNRKRL